MSVIFWTADNFKSTYKFDRFNFQPIVLFDGPVELDMLAIFKNIDDKKSYILTLDRNIIYIRNHDFIPDKNIIINDNSFKINLMIEHSLKEYLNKLT